MSAMRTTLLVLLAVLLVGAPARAGDAPAPCCTAEPLPGGAMIHNTCEACLLCTVEWREPAGTWREILAMPGKSRRESATKDPEHKQLPVIVKEEPCRSKP